MSRVALAHDWLTGMRGGEKVLEVLCDRYPDADILTLLHVPGSVSNRIERHPIQTSLVQHLPAAATRYRSYLPLFPLAVNRLDASPYDLLISTSHCAVKSIQVRPGARHLCYCFSPMRYAWDQFDAYFGPAKVGALKSRLIYEPIMRRMARWDAATAGRVHRFVAISDHVAQRIRRYYNRDATIVYPPVDTVFFHPADVPAGSHFLIVSALVPYKRIDLAIAACTRLGARLRIVGDGPERETLERAAGPNVEFLGWQTDEQIRDEYRRALAVLLPGEEDFGIVPLEAQACGRPVVALGRGGALETVVHGETGALSAPDGSVASFAAALRDAQRMTFDGRRIRTHAERFSLDRFVREFEAVVDDTVAAPAGTTW